MIATFAAVAFLSFIALAIPFIGMQPTLLIPLLAFGLGPISLTGAWAAWAMGLVANTYLPLMMAGIQRLDRYLIRKKDGEPVSPVPTGLQDYSPHSSAGTAVQSVMPGTDRAVPRRASTW